MKTNPQKDPIIQRDFFFWWVGWFGDLFGWLLLFGFFFIARFDWLSYIHSGLFFPKNLKGILFSWDFFSKKTKYLF